jgi:hypothetical protein
VQLYGRRGYRRGNRTRSLHGRLLHALGHVAPQGTYVNLFITLLGQIPPLPVELTVIRWSKGHMFGLEFIRIADKHITRLCRYTQDLEQVRGQ